MESKPRFCHSCGTELVGEATYCASCGAKQPAAIPNAAPDPTPAPAPVATPDSPLVAPKAKLSVFGLILSLAALAVTLFGILMTVLQMSAMMGKDFSNIGLPLLRSGSMGMVMAFVVPLLALILVLAKNKKLTKLGMILACVSLGLQFLFAIVYPIVITRGMDMMKLSFITRSLNGESLFMDCWRLLRFGANTGRQTLQILMSLFASMCYFLKNILALVACLLAGKKK